MAEHRVSVNLRDLMDVLNVAHQVDDSAAVDAAETLLRNSSASVFRARNGRDYIGPEGAEIPPDLLMEIG